MSAQGIDEYMINVHYYYCQHWIVCLSEKSVWSLLPTRQIFKGYFHSLLQTLKSNFHTQYESQKDEFNLKVLVHEYAQISCCFFSGTQEYIGLTSSAKGLNIY